MITVGNDRLAALRELSDAHDRTTDERIQRNIEIEVERVRRDYEFFAHAERA